MMVNNVIPVSQKSESERELVVRNIASRKARLNNASELTELFALFSLLGAIDLNINEGDANSWLIFGFVVNTALMVTNTVLVKIAIMWLSPRLETAVFMSKYDLSELDRIPYESLFITWDLVWLAATSGGFFLFLVEFILMAWIKFRHYSITISITATVIMTPVLLCVLLTGWISYRKIKK